MTDPPPLRIVQCVTDARTYGGAQRHVADLAGWLQRQGHSVEVMAGGRGPLAAQLGAQGVAFRPLAHLDRPLRPVRDARALAELIRALRAAAPDVLALHSSKAGLLGRYAARRLGIPAVYTAHGWVFSERMNQPAARAWALLERRAAAWGRALVTVSARDARLAAEFGIGVPAARFCIPNGVPDLPGSPPPPERDADAPVRLCTITRFVPDKDPETLLAALASLNARGVRNWRLDVYGSGPGEAAFLQRVAAEGLGGQVDYHGFTEHAAAALAACDVFILTSRKEGMPLSILEAMRAQRPVVATDVGGVAECVESGVTGRLVPRGDAPALADALAALAGDRAGRQAMGRAGRARYLRHHTLEAMAVRTVAVYAWAAGVGPRPDAGTAPDAESGGAPAP